MLFRIRMKKILPFAVLSCATPQYVMKPVVDIEPPAAMPDEQIEELPKTQPITIEEKAEFVAGFLEDYLKTAYFENIDDSTILFLQQTYKMDQRVLELYFKLGYFCKTHPYNGKDLLTKVNSVLRLQFNTSYDRLEIIDVPPYGSIDIVKAVVGEPKELLYPATEAVQELYKQTIDFLYRDLKEPQTGEDAFGFWANEVMNAEDAKKIEQLVVQSIKDIETRKPLGEAPYYMPCK